MNSTLTRRAAVESAAADAGHATRIWRALGTSAQVVVADQPRIDAACDAVVGVLDRVDRAASRFRDDSELSRINLAGGGWTEMSALLTRAMRVALDAAAWTGGLVDPTVGGALVGLGYDRTFRLVPPDVPGATVTVQHVPGWRQIELDAERRSMRLPAGVLLDLGATAKGLAADLAAQAAAEHAGCGVLVSLGGDVAVAGLPPDGGWAVAVGDTSDPDAISDGGPTQVVAIASGGVATSSITARRWRRGGSVVHHIVDPREGLPATASWRTVSVAAASCALANAASTAAVIVGADAPAWLAGRGLPARLVARNGSVVHVGGWPEDGEQQ